jgi:hypothetical protein
LNLFSFSIMFLIRSLRRLVVVGFMTQDIFSTAHVFEHST